MSSKQSHDSPGSNSDNIKVKISERYKPPHRINLPMSYSQRLNMNKQMQSTIPKYEFTLEKNILAKMKEWNSANAAYKQERKARLDVLREEVKRKEAKRKEEQDKLREEQEIQASDVTNAYSTDNSILMPTQASNTYSNILTPIPLSSQAHMSKPVDKSPFNISDFEDDTSSPFDNMELKSINDLEELAQVLKSDDSAQIKTNTHTFPSMQPSYSTYTNNSQYYVPNMPYMAQTSDYSRTNGYFYDSGRSFHQPYVYNQMDNSYTANPSQDATKANSNSYPDIIKSLETELNNTHLNNQKELSETAGQKTLEAVYPKPKRKTNDVEEFLSRLPQSEQDLCRSISSMGFPPDRVFRIIKLIGSDQKKVVDHLLALTDLLDLGFAEGAVSNALIQCNNDKDKALDILIT